LPPVPQMLLAFPPSPLLHLLPHPLAQPARIATFFPHLSPPDRSALRVGRHLHVERRVVPAVGHLHHPCVRIAGAHPQFLRSNLFSVGALSGAVGSFFLSPLQFRQLRQRLFQTLLPL